MKRIHIHVLVIFLISLSIVFVVQNGFNNSLYNSMSSSGSVSFNSVNNLASETSLNQSNDQKIAKQQNSLYSSIETAVPISTQERVFIDNEKLPIYAQPGIDVPGKNLNEDYASYSEDESDQGDEESSENNYDGNDQYISKNYNEEIKTSTGPFDEKVKYIIIVSYFRSGSSFLGDLIQKPKQTFYSFEPMKIFDHNHKIQPEEEANSLRIIQKIFQCSMAKEEKFFNWMCPADQKATANVRRNNFLMNACDFDTVKCCETDFIDRVCSQTKVRVIKETRLSLETVEKLLQILPPEIDVKVIFLVRDPRGIYNSRTHLKWCVNSSCIYYEQLCEDLLSDLECYPRLAEAYEDRVMIVRFEDLALDPFTKSVALFKFLGLPYTPEIDDFLDTHTNIPEAIAEAIPQINNPYVTLRNSKKVITKWMNNLSEFVVDSIQNSCEFVFDQLGYKRIALSEIETENFEDFDQIFYPNYFLPNHL